MSMGFSRQEYWSGLPFPSPGDLPDPGISQTQGTWVSRVIGRHFTNWTTREVQRCQQLEAGDRGFFLSLNENSSPLISSGEQVAPYPAPTPCPCRTRRICEYPLVQHRSHAERIPSAWSAALASSPQRLGAPTGVWGCKLADGCSDHWLPRESFFSVSAGFNALRHIDEWDTQPSLTSRKKKKIPLWSFNWFKQINSLDAIKINSICSPVRDSRIHLLVHRALASELKPRT